MPGPLSEHEQFLAIQIGERLQKESQSDTREKIGDQPMSEQKKPPSLVGKVDKVMQIINDIITPKGT